MAPSIYIATLLIAFGTPLLIFGFKYWAAAQQAKAHVSNEQAYRQLADRAAQAEARADTLQATVADLNTRVAAIEKILKEVE